MKNILLSVLVSFLSSCAIAQNTPPSERLQIILTVRNIFEGTDQHDWSKVQSAFAPEVFLDYSSLSGTPGSTLSCSEIIESWKKVIPGFDSIHHQLARFQVVIKDRKAKVHYFCKADHILAGEIWTVEGVYDTVLEKDHDQWLVTKHKFSLDQQRGDLTLVAKAKELVRSR
ncbi:hypothetical protein BH09BAC3_BH09BAC3_34190 [soil metagenome]